jgi:hypothetical protein
MSCRHDWIAWALLHAVAFHAATARADIYRWDTNQLIPGTQGIPPGPRVNLSSPMGEWSSPQRNLRFAEF